MNRLLWIAQIVAGIFFVFVGITHFLVPDGLPDMLSWMYDLSPAMHAVTGTAEILGGLGLILPAVTGIMPQLVPLAAAGLAVLMIGAVIYHVGRGEIANVGSNLLWIIVTGFIAWGRSKRHPIAARSA
jgi:uncharacterized membrane protein